MNNLENKRNKSRININKILLFSFFIYLCLVLVDVARGNYPTFYEALIVAFVGALYLKTLNKKRKIEKKND